MSQFSITSTNTNIDIYKLKLELESSSIMSCRVVSIKPNNTGVIVLIDAANTTSQTQLDQLKSLIDNHNNTQRRRILVHDLPDGPGSASNSEYVDSRTTNFLDGAKAYTDTKIAALVNSAPSTLDTLNELASALGSDPNFATTVSNRIGTAETRLTNLESRSNITNLDSISDVTISNPTNNQALQYVNGIWQNKTLAEVALTNQYSDLTGKPTLSTVSSTGSYSDLLNKPTLATVAGTGSYNDLLNKPTLATVAGTGSYSDLLNKPTLATVATTGSYNDLLNKPSLSANLDDLLDVTITTPSKGQLIVNNGTAFVNTSTIESATASTKTLILKGAAAQTANIFEAQNSSGTALFSIDKDGSVSAGTVPVARVTGLATVATTGSYNDLADKPASVFPTGMLVPFAGTSVPSGWLLCDGLAISRSTYSALFGVIGTIYGVGNGSTTFNVPDLRSRVPVGKGTTINVTMGDTDGVAEGSRYLTHNHSVTVKGHYHDMTGAGSTLSTDIAHTHGASAVTITSDGGHTHTVTIGDAGAHSHSLAAPVLLRTYSSGSAGLAFRSGSSDAYTDPTHNIVGTGDHSHTATVTTVSGHAHPGSTAAGQSLGTTTVSATGKIGKVTLGADGNSDQPCTSTSTIGVNYVIMNYIIKT